MNKHNLEPGRQIRESLISFLKHAGSVFDVKAGSGTGKKSEIYNTAHQNGVCVN
jgi:hypothetical protein